MSSFYKTVNSLQTSCFFYAAEYFSRGKVNCWPLKICVRFYFTLVIEEAMADHMETDVFDVIIVGGGMMGSAAAFHASQIENTAVCLIGPSEPKIRKGQEVFGAWFDEGRICHQVDDSYTWFVLTMESLNRFRQLESESGVDFYTEAGYVQVMKSQDEFTKSFEYIREHGLVSEDITKTWKKHFPELNLPDDAFVLWEKTISGHISPRNLVKAHRQLAIKNGAKIVEEIVCSICPASASTYKWDVLTENGNVFHSKLVLVAAGAYAGLKPLFQHVTPQKVPDLELRTQTVAYLRISSEEAKRLKSMPSIVTKYEFENLDGAYILPPILYPDGHWYLKLGHGRAFEVKKETLNEVASWYVQQSGIPDCVENLAKLLHHMIPGLQVEAVTGDGCLTAHTPTEEPYIDMVTEGFAVALGGNGYAAKSSSEIGRLAARLLVLGEWDSKITREKVMIKWKQTCQL